MKHIKLFENASQDVIEKFKDVSAHMGLDPKWFAEYIQECLEYNLDSDSLPEDVVVKAIDAITEINDSL